MVRGNRSSTRSKNPCRCFPVMVYEMVNDPSTDSVISWSENGNSFIVWKESELCDVLPRFSQSRIVSLFIKWLGLYGFRKVVESEQCEYANDDFVRGKPELLREIQKRYIASRPPKSFEFKRIAQEPRINARTRALEMALKESDLANSLSNLTL